MNKYLICFESWFYHTFCTYKVEAETMKKAIAEFREHDDISEIFSITKLEDDVEWGEIEV